MSSVDRNSPDGASTSMSSSDNSDLIAQRVENANSSGNTSGDASDLQSDVPDQCNIRLRRIQLDNGNLLNLAVQISQLAYPNHGMAPNGNAITTLGQDLAVTLNPIVAQMTELVQEMNELLIAIANDCQHRGNEPEHSNSPNDNTN